MKDKISLIEVQGGSSKGGYEYNELATPATISYKFEYLKKFQIGSDNYWHGYIKGKEIKEKKLPLDANPRKPSPTKVVRLMQSTIQKHPSQFHHLNNGITIIASKVKFNESNCIAEIHFGKPYGNHGDGVCNGGHSYYAIDQFKAPISNDLLVRVEIIELDPSLDKDQRANKVKLIAEARNAHNELDSITTAHYSGYYDEFIRIMGANSKFIKWYEGDPNAIKNAESVDMFIAKLTATCPHWYSHYLNVDGNTGNHMPSARNQGSVHKKWLNAATQGSEERSMNYMLPLINDIVNLIDEISYSLKVDDFSGVRTQWRKTRIWKYLSEKKNLKKLNHKIIDGKNADGYDLSHTFISMILGAFRENIWYSESDEGINYVGWLKDPVQLWHAHRVKLMRNLDQIASSISAPSFGNAFLQNPAIYNYQLTEFEFGAKIEEYLDKPDIVYDVSTGEKFIKSKKNMNKTHFLQVDHYEEIPVPLAEMIKGKKSSAVAYTHVDLC